jgi:thioredoxin reductase (NADPH)
MKDAQLIVIGGGIGGAASALRAVQYHLPTIWILGDRSTSKASRAAYVQNIDNMIGIHPGITQSQLAERVQADHPEAARRIREEHLHISTRDVVENARSRIEADFADQILIVEDRAVEAQVLPVTPPRFRVRVAGGAGFDAPALVLSTGVMDRQPVIHKERAGRDVSGIHWVFPYANHETLLYCIRCEGHLTPGRRVALLGSGDAAAEVALMVRERYGSQVVVLTMGEDPIWSEQRARLLELQGIAVHRERLVDIEGADRGATLRAFVLAGGSRVEVDLAFVAMGLHRVYNDLARQLGADLEDTPEPPELRHVRVDRNGETSVPGLFAVGDMARRRDELLMKQIYTAQEYAVRAIDTIDRRRRKAARASLLGTS